MDTLHSTALIPASASPGGAEPTMSSLDIAELTGKEHRNVLRDCRRMFEDLELTQLTFERSYTDPTGRSLVCFNLPKDLTMTLCAGYSVPLRHKIVTRWMELEQAARPPAPALPTTMVEALRLAADEMERRVVAEAALIEATPKVEFYDDYVDATGLETLRTVAKILGRPERAFVQTLISDRVLFRSPSHRYALMPFATYAKAGYFEVKTGTTSGHLWAQTRWTPKGVAWATSRYGTKGAA